MKHFRESALCLILAAQLLLSCNESGFNSGTQKDSDAKSTDQKAKPTIDLSNDDLQKKAKSEPTLIPKGKAANIVLDPAAFKADHNGEKQPLSIYFLIDVTKSMQEVIDAFKENIITFAKKLEGRNFDAKIGFISFRDWAGESKALTSDSDSFRQEVEKLVAIGGVDRNEASLTAIQEGLKRIIAEEQRPSAAKVLLLITDNPGHHQNFGIEAENKIGVVYDPDTPQGKPAPMPSEPRSCAITSTVEAFNALPASGQKNIRLFYSTGTASDSRPAPCGGYNTAAEQMADLTKKILTGVSEKERGGPLSWPFTGKTLVDDFTSMLDEKARTIKSLCMAEEARVVVKGETIFQWKASSTEELFKLHQNGAPLILADAIPQDKVNGVEKSGAEVIINRCCLSEEDLVAKKWAKCSAQAPEKIPFLIKIE